jgi:hypothetical protein
MGTDTQSNEWGIARLSYFEAYDIACRGGESMPWRGVRAPDLTGNDSGRGAGQGLIRAVFDQGSSESGASIDPVRVQI